MLSSTDGTTQQNAQLLMSFAYALWIHVTVKTPGSIRIGDSRVSLEATVGGLKGGLVISNNDGTKSFAWKGELWVMADTPANIIYDIEAPGYQKGSR